MPDIEGHSKPLNSVESMEAATMNKTAGNDPTDYELLSNIPQRDPEPKHIKSIRKYYLKITPIEARNLPWSNRGTTEEKRMRRRSQESRKPSVESARTGTASAPGTPSMRTLNPYCTLVLLDENKKEIKNEKQKTPVLRDCCAGNVVWSPLKLQLLRTSSAQPHGIEAAAATEEYTFGANIDLLSRAKFLLIKCKNKNIMEVEDLGRLLLSLDELDITGKEQVQWYPLQHYQGIRQVSTRKLSYQWPQSISFIDLKSEPKSAPLLTTSSSKIFGQIRKLSRRFTSSQTIRDEGLEDEKISSRPPPVGLGSYSPTHSIDSVIATPHLCIDTSGAVTPASYRNDALLKKRSSASPTGSATTNVETSSRTVAPNSRRQSANLQSQIRIASRIVREPDRRQLWQCARQMMDELPFKTHSIYLRNYEKCISGKEMVDWMLCHGLNRPTKGDLVFTTEDDAVIMGNCMIRAGILEHVLSESRPFVNHLKQYYRFSISSTDVTKQNNALSEMYYVLEGLYNEEVVDCNSLELPIGTGSPTLDIKQWLKPQAVFSRRPRPRQGSSASASGNETSPVSVSVEQLQELPVNIPHVETEKIEQNCDLKKEETVDRTEKLSIRDFELLHVLGSGTYSRVLSAKGPDKKLYAIKIVSKIGIDARRKNAVKIEHGILQKISHPYVAGLEFAFQNEDKLYMGIEYLNGGDLRYHLNLQKTGNVKISAERIQLYAAEIVLGLSYLHQMNIVYRDLKPENIVIGSDGHIKIVDFGLSRQLDTSGVQATTLVGTPDYVAPEILAMDAPSQQAESYFACVPALDMSKGNRSGYGHSCDWWSLGILLFEIYMGRTPFHDPNLSVMYRNILEGTLYIPRELQNDIAADLIKGLLDKNPSSRLGGATEGIPTALMQHPYFKKIDWDLLTTKKIRAPWKPEITREEDAYYIDDEFREQEAIDTPEWRMLDEIDKKEGHFDNFTFQAVDLKKPLVNI